MEPTNRQLLETIRGTLADRVMPALTDPAAIKGLALVGLALGELSRRDHDGERRRESLRDAVEGLAGRGSALVAELRIPAADGDGWPARPDGLTPTWSPEDGIEAAWERVASLSAQLLSARAGGSLSGEDTDRVTRFLTEVLEVECAEKARDLTPPSDEPEEDVAARISALGDYLAERLGVPGSIVRAVRQLSGGFSNTTFHVTVGSPDGDAVEVVIRRCRQPGLLWPYGADLAEELPFIALARAAGVPAPRPLWLEPDEAVLGAPFLVTEFVPGRLVGDYLTAGGELSDALIGNYAQAIARLHRAPWQEHAATLPDRFVGLEALTIESSVDLILARLRRYIAEACLTPSPVLLILLDWLERHKPHTDGAPVLTHGDLGFHNWLFDGDTPTVLLDWETIALASPVKDLSVVRDVAVPPSQWQQFLAAYVAEGGVAPAEDEFAYYKMLHDTEAIAVTGVAWEKMLTVADPLNIDYIELGIGARAHFFGGVAANASALA